LGPLVLDSSIPSKTIPPKNTFLPEVSNSLTFSFVGIIFVFLGWVLIPTSNLSLDDLGFFVYKVGPEPIVIYMEC